MIYLFLYIPIISIIYIYYKNYNFKKKFLFAEAYIAITVICYCGYYLVHYRIHHSYAELTNNDYLSGIYTFYLLFLATLFYLHLLNKKNIFDNIKLSGANYISEIIRKNENSIIFSFIFFGLLLFTFNRMGFLVCNSVVLEKIQNIYLLDKFLLKLHTISYFAFFLVVAGLLLFFEKIKKGDYLKVFVFIFILSILIIIVLNSSTSISLIISYLIISSIYFHRKSKIIFYINLFILTILILSIQSVKSEIRKEISPMIWDCKFNVIENSILISKITLNSYYLNQNKMYLRVDGSYAKVLTKEIFSDELTPISTIRFNLSNFLERVDMLQMLSQNKYMVKNNDLNLKLGETYFNPKKKWQKIFGVDIRQANLNDNSSFNMPASVESFYNFGNIGFLLFSILMGAIIYLIGSLLNSKIGSSQLKIILLVIFFPFLNLENHLIFMTKNSLYIAFLLFGSIMVINYFFLKINKRS
jgi:hypothetical protein